jgi:HK97 family phage major capsid protein
MDIEIKQAVDGLMTAFEEFKKANDERLKEIEKKGVATPETLAKIAKLETAMAATEPLNAKFTAEAEARKAAKEEADKESAALKEQIDKLEVKLGRVGLGDPNVDPKVARKAAWNDWIRGACNAITVGAMNLPENQKAALEAARTEAKALNVTNDTAGGYLAPVEYVREIIKAETEMSPMRTIVRVRSTVNKSIQIPKRTGQFAAVWVAEQGTKSETTGLAYGLEEITLPELYALIDISNQMLEDAAFDMEAELRMESAEQFAVAEGAAVVNGSGVGRPEGFLVNASVGETVSGAATTVTADGLLSLFYAIKTAYSRNATWALNRTTLGSVRKLKDGDGNYLWMPGLAMGQPNSINSAPYVEVPDMPDEGSNTYPVAFGDFRRGYTLVDRIAMEMLRDPFTQATSGNVRFIFRRRLGGQVTLAEAIRKLKCST